MEDLKSREDVNRLVRTFYAKLQKNELLGPVFNGVIDDWEHHFERLTDFWETNLFFVRKYHGKPTEQHIHVDEKEEGSIMKCILEFG